MARRCWYVRPGKMNFKKQSTVQAAVSESAWIILLLLLTEMLILERKNPLFRNIHLFSNKK